MEGVGVYYDAYPTYIVGFDEKNRPVKHVYYFKDSDKVFAISENFPRSMHSEYTDEELQSYEQLVLNDKVMLAESKEVLKKYEELGKRAFRLKCVVDIEGMGPVPFSDDISNVRTSKYTEEDIEKLIKTSKLEIVARKEYEKIWEELVER